MKIEMQFIDTLESVLSESIEYAMCFDGSSGFCLIGDEKLFKTEKEAIIYALKVEEYYAKVKNLKMSDKVVPVYDDDEFLLYYISEEEANRTI